MVGGMVGRTISGDRWLGTVAGEKDDLVDLLDNAPCAYHCLDATGTFVLVNATVTRWLGSTAQELLGQVKFADVLTPESAAVYEDRMAGPRGRQPISGLDLEILGPNGTRRPVILCTNVALDGRGGLVATRAVMVERRGLRVASARRLTELVKATDVRAQSLDEALVEAMRHFAYLDGELHLPASLRHDMVALREALLRGGTLAREILALTHEALTAED